MTEDIPVLEEHIIHKKIVSAKKPDSAVPGDLPKKVIKALKLTDVVPIPKSTTTFKSFITPKGTAKATNGDSQFSKPKRLPNVNEVKKLIGLVCADATDKLKDRTRLGGRLRVS